MYETFLARKYFYETTEVLGRLDDAAVDLAFFDFATGEVDFLDGAIHRFFASCVDVYLAAVVVIDVELSSGDFNDTADVLATWSDEGADLFRIDLNSRDAWSIFADAFTWSIDRFCH